MVKFALKVTSSNIDIERQILAVVAHELNGRLYDIYKPIITEIRTIFKEEIEKDAVWQSLKTGELQSHMGLYPNDVKPDAILDIWLASIDARFQKFTKKGNTWKAGLSLSLIEDDFNDVLAAPAAEYISQTKKQNGNLSAGYLIPWLRWLLIEGDRIVVRNYDINLKLTGRGQVSSSRSGKALMFVKKGAGYRLPPQYTGTINNNFVKDALNRIDSRIQDLITDNVEYAL